MNIKDFIKEKFSSGEWLGCTKKQIYEAIGTKSTFERKAVDDVLNAIEKDGIVVKVEGKFLSPFDCGYLRGTIRGNERGFAFVTADNGEDYFIPHKSLNGACNKDEVIIRKVVSDRGSSDEAEVVKVISRGVTKLCGTYYKEKTFGFVRPDDKNYYNDIYIPFSKSKNAAVGDKVCVNIVAFPEGDNPHGEVEEIIGKGGELLSEENSVIKSFGYSEAFSAAVMNEVEKIPQKVPHSAFIGRKDLTKRTIITIDGEDSRDFDDAVEVEVLKNGNYLLGVHIADVSEYVKPHTPLDKEAFERSDSTYFPDRVVPMLPKELSNGICSLNENEPRLTLSCVMEIDKNGDVVNREIFKSVIKSHKRATYTAVQAVLDGDAKTIKEYKKFVPMIKKMCELQLLLTKKRSERGSIDLDVRDSHITLKDGKVNVELQTSLVAYKIIEEFMVLCNEEIAGYLYYLDLPCVYRVHERPSKEKAEAFIGFLNTLGIVVKWKPDECRSSDYSAILKKIAGEPIYPVVNKVMLRSMQKARYCDQNLGHFGISSKCYCHFTSPIRRYSDLIVHRIVKASLDGDMSVLFGEFESFVAEAAKHASVCERKSDEAERAVDDIYKAAYAYDRRGEEYDAVISGVTSFGVFSELPNGVEGLTRLEYLPRGKYVYDEKTYSLKSGKYCFRIGDTVRIGIMGADIGSRRVDFIILALNGKNLG